jgi:hypothetical protein
MSPYDVTPDDEPIDMAGVSADDRMVEKLRHALSPDSAVIWDDEDDEVDPAIALLRALQRDVSSDLPSDFALPPRVGGAVPRRRRLGRGATVAAVAAGVLSIGGVAAAAAPGQPLAGMRSAVSSAVSHVVHAITLDAPAGPAVAAPSHTSRPSTNPTAGGQAVSAAARSASAVLQIEANLARAESFLNQGKYSPANAQLAAAARKLDYVVGAADRARLATRLAALKARLAATPDPAASGSSDDSGGTTRNGSSGSGSSGSSGNDDSRKDDSGKDDSGKDSSGRDDSGKDSSGKEKAATPDPESSPDVAPSRDALSGDSARRPDPEPSDVRTPDVDEPGDSAAPATGR